MLNKIIDKFKNIDKYKSILGLIAVVVMSTFFVVALTFNDIGNGITSTYLILGFVFSLLAVGIGVGLGFYMNKNRDAYLIIFSGVAFLLLFALLSFIFGAIGYLEFHN